MSTTIISNMKGLSNTHLEELLNDHSSLVLAQHHDYAASSIMLHDGAQHRQTGYGTWSVSTDWTIDGRKAVLSATTHDAEVIDALRSDDAETRQDAMRSVVLSCIIARVDAFEAV